MTSVLTRTLKAKNRRAAGRYGVKMSLRYRTAAAAPNFGWAHGHTLNMSAGGVLICIPEAKPAGSVLELAIEWPGLYFDRPMVRLFLVGVIVRIDGRGAALRILRRRFCYIDRKDLAVA